MKREGRGRDGSRRPCLIPIGRAILGGICVRATSRPLKCKYKYRYKNTCQCGYRRSSFSPFLFCFFSLSFIFVNGLFPRWLDQSSSPPSSSSPATKKTLSRQICTVHFAYVSAYFKHARALTRRMHFHFALSTHRLHYSYITSSDRQVLVRHPFSFRVRGDSLSPPEIESYRIDFVAREFGSFELAVAEFSFRCVFDFTATNTADNSDKFLLVLATLFRVRQII